MIKVYKKKLSKNFYNDFYFHKSYVTEQQNMVYRIHIKIFILTAGVTV